MPAAPAPIPLQARLDALRTEFADLAFDLERKGRRDAADVVMMIDSRVRELAEEIAREETGFAGIPDVELVAVGRALCPTINLMSGINPDLQK